MLTKLTMEACILASECRMNGINNYYISQEMNLLAREVGGVAPVRDTGAGRVTGRRSKGQDLVVRERRKG